MRKCILRFVEKYAKKETIKVFFFFENIQIYKNIIKRLLYVRK